MRPLVSAFVWSLALGLAAPASAREASAPTATPAPEAPAAAAVEAAPPRLVLAISVDQFSADLFAQYREHFRHGLARLLTGAVFPSGYQSHAATETCPGHSTLLTGTHPARNGIIANNWYDPALGREIYCAEDEADPASSADDPVVSPGHLRAPTLGDLLKRRNPASLNAAVSAKDRAAVMMSGHDTDAVYWFKGKGFATFAGRKLSPAAEAQNAALAAAVTAGAGELPVPAWCGAVDRALPLGDFTIGTYRFPLKAGDFKGFNRSPRMDGATADLAIRLLDEMPLGRDAVPDVLSVSFSATDYAGKAEDARLSRRRPARSLAHGRGAVHGGFAGDRRHREIGPAAARGRRIGRHLAGAGACAGTARQGDRRARRPAQGEPASRRRLYRGGTQGGEASRR